MVLINDLWEELLLILVDVLLVELDFLELATLTQTMILNFLLVSFLMNLVWIDESSVIYVEVIHAYHANELST